jgi:hypothetical protein
LLWFFILQIDEMIFNSKAQIYMLKNKCSTENKIIHNEPLDINISDDLRLIVSSKNLIYECLM